MARPWAGASLAHETARARPAGAAHWGFGASVAVDEAMVFVAALDGIVRAFRHDP